MKSQRRLLFQGVLLLGLFAACAAPQPSLAGQALRHQVGPYEVEVLTDGMPASTFPHRGETYVLGHRGDRYVLRVHNRSDRRVEAVVTVDGLDVIDGKAGGFAKRGYLIPAWGSVDIDGWRLSNEQVAAFRFSAVANSYAGRTGRARDVGVIGVAVFPERAGPRPPFYSPRRSRAPWPTEEEGRDDVSRDWGAREEAQAPAVSGAAASAPPSAAAPAPAREADSAAEAGPARKSVRPQARPGLGTEFGEQLASGVHEVSFERANAVRPAAVLGLRYNDRGGLAAMGIDVDGSHAWSDADLRRTATPFPASTTRGFAQPPRGWNGY